jgi:diguanylate cyclase (GGDEF)-like protein
MSNALSAGLSTARRAVLYLAILAIGWISLANSATALQPILVSPDQDRLEITSLGEYFDGRGDSLQVETAPGMDGISGRISVRATTPGTSPSWIVFALRNQTDKPVERWVTAERYSVIGSGVVWPDLDARRIETLTPSIGFVPERVKSDRADIFRITLEPGQTITYVAELSSERFARIYLWKPIDYELKARDRQLFNGINLGLVGLLAIFLTAVFAANHKVIFPATALVAWCVLAYLCVDFGFWHKLFQLRPEDNAVYRAATEAAIAASLVIFLHTFLRLGLWHGFMRVLVSAWIIAQLSLVAVAVIDPRLASTFARVSFAVIGGVGLLFTLFLALRGQDRALSLVPTWLLFLVWNFGAGVVVTGRLAGDIVVSGLVAGLVLIVVLLGFTVTQFAFRALEPLYGASPNDMQLRSMAVDGAGSAIWEWNTRRDEFKISAHVEAALELPAGALSTTVEDFVKHVHPADRERFRLTLWSVQERNGGTIHIDFRMRHTDNSYRWFEIEAASLPATDRRALRCVGLMRDVTDSKRAHERLLHDAVHDSLTGLPNRELFLDRLSMVCLRVASEPHVRPTVIFIDIDKFNGVNANLGLIVGDSLLLTTARRLARHLGPLDTLARIGGDQFAILLTAGQEPRDLAALAERIRRSLRSPIKIADQEIVLTGSLGIAVYDGSELTRGDLLKDAEIAMYRAKRGGTDRIEIFRPEMSVDRDERAAVEADLKKALEKSQVRVLYQPIIYLQTEELAGFEAVLRWEHPKLGVTNPATIAPVDEASDTVARLGSYALTRATQDVARWQKELPRPDSPLFVSVSIASSQLFRQDLVQEVRHIFGRALVPKGALKLEVNEALIMENPEQAAEILEWLRGAGAELSLDDFGTGYSSLAYLQRFAFDTVKLDRGLVQSAHPAGAGSAMVRSIVALAHELGKKIVAEGVETSEDVAFLRSIGCEYAQGLYYSEPMAEREVLSLLRAVRKSERKLQRRGFLRSKAKDVAPREHVRPAPTPIEQTADRALPSSSSDTDGEAPVAQTGKAAGTPAPAKKRRLGLRKTVTAASTAAADDRSRTRPQAPQAASNATPTHVHAQYPNGLATPVTESGYPRHDEPSTAPPEYRSRAMPPPMPETRQLDHYSSLQHADAPAPTGAYAPEPAEPTHAPYPAHHADDAAMSGAMNTLSAALSANGHTNDHAAGYAHNGSYQGNSATMMPPHERPAAQPNQAYPDEHQQQLSGTHPPFPADEPTLPPFSAALPTAAPPSPVIAAPPAQTFQQPIQATAAPDMPQLKTLPPAIAASLARLAGLPASPARHPVTEPPARKKVSGDDR